jgi:hypothetical protein
MSMAMSIIQMSIDGLEVETLSESAGEMEIEITDYTLSMTAAGQTEKVTMGDIKNQLGVSGGQKVRLKSVNGDWLVNETSVITPFAGLVPNMPTVPSPVDGGC